MVKNWAAKELDLKLDEVWKKVGSDWKGNENVKKLEGDFMNMVEKFDKDARAYRAIAKFYQLDIRDIDKAVEAIEKAAELDWQDISNAMAMAELYYRWFSIGWVGGHEEGSSFLKYTGNQVGG